LDFRPQPKFRARKAGMKPARPLKVKRMDQG
jgi:hypothetical protein